MQPDVEWHLALPMPDLPPDQRVFHGHNEVRAVWERLSEAWEEITIEIEEVLSDADDVLVLVARFHARGKGSGVEVERPVFYVLELKDGLLVRIRPFESREEALAEA